MTGLIIYTLIITLLLISIWKNPGVTLVAVLCLFAIDQWGLVTSTFLRNNSSLSNIILGSLVLVGFLKSLLTGRINKFHLTWNKSYLVSIILVTYSAVSILWSPMYDTALDKWIDQAPYFIVMVWLMPLTLNNAQYVEKSLTIFQIMGIFLVLLFLFFVEWEGRGIVIDGQQSLALPLAIAQLAAMTFFSSLFYKNNRFNLVMIYRLVSMCLPLALIFQTGSRGPIFSVVICGLLFLPFYLNVNNLRGVIAFSIIISVAALASFYSFNEFSSTDTRWSDKELTEDMLGRFNNIGILLDKWADGNALDWLFGLGSSASFSPNILGFYPHNVPLEILAEEGLVGFSLFIIILFISLKYIIKHIALNKLDLEGKAASIVFSAATIFMLLHSIKSGAFVGSSYLLMTFVVLERYYYLRLIRLKRVINNSKVM